MIELVAPETVPRPAQVKALSGHGILNSRRNLVVAAPTNSGKTLIGLLPLLDAARKGRRAILLEPLRALAREKYEQLRTLEPVLSGVLGRRFRVRISTGDYRLENDVFNAPPPADAELLIATPERLEAVLRNPQFEGWLDTLGAICVDEAHLICTPRRGPTLEYLITSLLCRSTPPRMILLSATMGDCSRAAEWLDPCDVIRDSERCSPLHREVWALEPEEDADEAITTATLDWLAHECAKVMVFVYQTRTAERLARHLTTQIGQLLGEQGALAYHSQISTGRRAAIQASFAEGSSRCIVATTALSLGVNLPASHVIVRDTVFPGVGPLSVGELLQMMGRAGRGSEPGQAAAIVRTTDERGPHQLASALSAEELKPLHSAFEQTQGSQRREYGETAATAAAPLVMAQLCRFANEGVTVEQLAQFFSRSLGARSLTPELAPALGWLADPARTLVYADERGRYYPTALGRKGARATLPLSLVAGVGQLIRDLLVLGHNNELIEDWKPLDHLVLTELLSDRSPALRPFSEKLAAQVDGWMEGASEQVPLLFRQWITGQASHSRAGELLGSLGLRGTYVGGKSGARKRAYQAAFRAILIWERSRGVRPDDLERRWGVMGLEEIEERWRDDLLWLLGGLARILDLRCFYYHLRETCSADFTRVRRVKRLLRSMRYQAFDLQEQIKYCSALGPLLRDLRRMNPSGERKGLGIQSIRKLEQAGVRSLSELATLSNEDLRHFGLHLDAVQQIRAYLRRRLA